MITDGANQPKRSKILVTSESTLRLVHTSVSFTMMVKVNLSTSGSQAIPKILTGWSSLIVCLESTALNSSGMVANTSGSFGWRIPLDNSLPVYVFFVNFNLAKHLFNISVNSYTENSKLDKNREKFWLHSWANHEQIIEIESRRSFTEGVKDNAKLCCTAGVPNNSMVRKV
ncbi:hypothetical protein TNCV_924471 [Trichonephila clavipes]|nr:hypothetical protein TNCV_924471 [Trichonephila clavipes]